MDMIDIHTQREGSEEFSHITYYLILFILGFILNVIIY